MFALTVIISVVAAVAFAVSGYSKVNGAEPERAQADRLGVEWPAYRLIGVAELLGAAGLLVGLWLSWLGAVAAFCLVALMIGALYTHMTAGDRAAEMRPAMLYGLLALFALLFRLATL